MSTQDWDAHVRRFYAMTPGQQNEEWQKMSPDQRKEFTAARDLLAKAAEEKRNSKTTGRWSVAVPILLGVGLVLYVGSAVLRETSPGIFNPPSGRSESSDVRQARDFLDDLPPECDSSSMSVARDGTVTIYVRCPGVAEDGTVTIKDGIVRGVR